MNRNTTVTVGLLIVALFGGYLLGSNYPLLEVLQQDGVSAPVIPLVEEWRGAVTGDVIEVSTEAITISSNEQTLVVSFADEVSVSKTKISNNEPQETVDGLSVDDIEIGDRVGLSLIADNDGNLQTERVNVFELQE